MVDSLLNLNNSLLKKSDSETESDVYQYEYTPSQNYNIDVGLAVENTPQVTESSYTTAAPDNSSTQSSNGINLDISGFLPSSGSSNIGRGFNVSDTPEAALLMGGSLNVEDPRGCAMGSLYVSDDQIKSGALDVKMSVTIAGRPFGGEVLTVGFTNDFDIRLSYTGSLDPRGGLGFGQDLVGSDGVDIGYYSVYLNCTGRAKLMELMGINPEQHGSGLASDTFNISDDPVRIQISAIIDDGESQDRDHQGVCLDDYGHDTKVLDIFSSPEHKAAYEQKLRDDRINEDTDDDQEERIDDRNEEIDNGSGDGENVDKTPEIKDVPDEITVGRPIPIIDDRDIGDRIDNGGNFDEGEVRKIADEISDAPNIDQDLKNAFDKGLKDTIDAVQDRVDNGVEGILDDIRSVIDIDTGYIDQNSDIEAPIMAYGNSGSSLAQMPADLMNIDTHSDLSDENLYMQNDTDLI